MIFNYIKQKNGKVYVFDDLDVGETFMLSDPRKDASLFSAGMFDDFSVYMVVDNKQIVDLSDGGLRPINNPKLEVYPVICESSVRLYPDVQ